MWDERGAAQVSTKLLEDLGASYELGGRPLIAVFRVGAALYPEHGRTVENCSVACRCPWCR